jgi:hypothetical protein
MLHFASDYGETGTTADVSCGLVTFVKNVANIGYHYVLRWRRHWLMMIYIGCTTTNQTRQFFNNFTTNEDIAQQLGAHHRHIPLHFSPTNVLLLKSRYNIFIGFGIIKELPGLVGSGTPYSFSAVRILYLLIY